MKIGRKHACSGGSGISVDLLAYEFIIIFDESGLDIAVDEI